MHSMLILNLLALIFIFILICILCSYLRHSFQSDRKWLPPYISTYPNHRALIRKKLQLKQASSILDLGCGDGRMLRLFVNDLGCRRAVGYDINPFAIRRGRRLNTLRRMSYIQLINDDIYNTEVKWFDYIYLYLFPDFIAQLEPRLFDNIDADTVIICNTFHFIHHTPFEIIRDRKWKERLYLYRKSSL